MTTWENVRYLRNKWLAKTDFHFLSDNSGSDELKEHRQFLRDVPQNYDTPDEALIALADNQILESVPE